MNVSEQCVVQLLTRILTNNVGKITEVSDLTRAG